MDNTSKKQVIKNDEFDYFYVLIKNWKIIFFSCIVFFLLGVLLIVFTPKTYTAKSTFSIALKKEIITSYGTYELKTNNPIHYLNVIEQNQFKNQVLRELGYKDLRGINFNVEEEKIVNDPKSSDLLSPSKFDFLVTGFDPDKLIEISNEALSTFIVITDSNFLKDIYNKFSSELVIQIDNLKFNIQIKEKLIADLKESLKIDIDINEESFNLKDLYDNRLINSLEGGEKGLIISMILSGSKGSRIYQESILSYEEAQLKTMGNKLERQELLLAKLNDNKEKATLASLFNLPFSSNYFLLSSPEIKQVSTFNSNLKRILIFLFIGFFLSTSIILLRSYYNLKSQVN